MSNDNAFIPVVFITDDNYAMPTAVAITSLYYNKNEKDTYKIHVICTDVTEDNIRRISSLSKPDFIVEIMQQDAEKYADIGSATVHVTSAAMYKFELPNLFSQYDKILYLDGDMLITKDIRPLFDTDISDRYAAVVKDYKTNIYKPTQLAKLHIDHKHKFYWNSGMMLLNLAKMRKDDLPKKLLDYKLNGINYFMDQDALNVVFQENVKYVSFEYNTMSTLPVLYEPKILIDFYGIDEYETIEELLSRATIIHLTGPHKPWEHLIPIYSDLYSFYYSKSPYADIPLQLLDNDKPEQNDYKANEPISITYCCTNPNATAVMVSIASLIHNKRPETKYHIRVFCTCVDMPRMISLKNLSAENCEIEIIDNDFYDYENINDQTGCPIPAETVTKFRLADYIPEKKTIYINEHTLVLKDLSDMYSFDMDGCYIAAVRDFSKDMGEESHITKNLYINNGRYFSTNVMIVDLDAFRRERLAEQLFFYKKHGANYYADSDAYNVCFRDKILEIPFYYNAMTNLMADTNLVKNAQNLDIKRYANLAELYSRCYIISFTANEKPWKSHIPLLTDMYARYYIRSNASCLPYKTAIDEQFSAVKANNCYDICFEETSDINFNRAVKNALYPSGEFEAFSYEDAFKQFQDDVLAKYGKVSADGFNKETRDVRIIVSMTTIPFRIEAAAVVISIMMHQTMKPDEIIINLGDKFFEGVQLPELLLEEEKCGVKINFCHDLYCHTKYFHTIKSHPDDIVITVDDDIIYSETLIEELYASYQKFPNAVSAMRAHLITFDEKNDELAPYNKWKYCCSDYIGIPTHKMLATGVGGVLYPPHAFTDELFNVDALLKVCPKADDLWLKVMEIVNDTPVVVVKRNHQLSFIGDTQDVGLCYDNVGNSQNDAQLIPTMKMYEKACVDGSTLIEKLMDESDTVPVIRLGMDKNKKVIVQPPINNYNKRLKNLEHQLNDLRKTSTKTHEDTVHLNNIRNSVSFKVGRVITWLPRKIRDIIKRK